MKRKRKAFAVFTIVSILLLTNYKLLFDLYLQDDFKKNTTDYWYVTDLYDRKGHKSLNNFFEENDSLERLKRINQVLHNDYIFLESINQPVEYFGWYSNSKQFVPTGALVNQELKINEKDCKITPLNALQISNETWKYFKLHCDIGRDLIKEDYLHDSSTNIIPVVLGHNYREIYNINDEIICSYLFQTVTLKIVGFLEPQTEIFDTICDNYIIMPAFNLSDVSDVWDEKIQKILYSQKNQGKILNISDRSGITENQNIINKGLELDLNYSLLGYENLLYEKFYYILIVVIILFIILVYLLNKFYQETSWWMLLPVSSAVVLFFCIHSTRTQKTVWYSIILTVIFIIAANFIAYRLKRKDKIGLSDVSA